MTPAFPSDSCVTLPRGQILASGDDAEKFLQNIVTHDLNRLVAGASLHACLLTPQGKFLHDFIITREDDTIVLDCEPGERAIDLHKRLNLYKLRAKASLDLRPNVPVYVSASKGIQDPRHAGLGLRSWNHPGLRESPHALWDEIRIRLGIPDGSRDAEIGKSSLEELNLTDTAVSFEKGCYIGQELTARIEHRGLAKRHLVPLGFNIPLPAWGDDIMVQGQPAGSMRSSCATVGLALIRDDTLDLLRAEHDQSPIYLLGQ